MSVVSTYSNINQQIKLLLTAQSLLEVGTPGIENSTVLPPTIHFYGIITAFTDTVRLAAVKNEDFSGTRIISQPQRLLIIF